MIQISFPPLDIDTEKRRALAKVYSLLIKLAEEKESVHMETSQEIKEASAPLKNNIPTGQ